MRHSGHFRMVAHKMDEDGNILSTRELASFDNIITDYGLNTMGTNSSASLFTHNGTIWGGSFAYLGVGSGTATPTASDTALAAPVARVNTTVSNSGGIALLTGTVTTGDPYVWTRGGWRFATGVAAGNLTEIGLVNASGNAFSRALIRDSNGVPTTVTVLADEVLDCWYELRSYPDTAATIFSFEHGGVTHTATVVPCRLGSWSSIHNLTAGSSLSEAYHTAVIMPASITDSMRAGTGGGTFNSGSEYYNTYKEAYVQNSLQQGTYVSATLNGLNHANGIAGMTMVLSGRYYAVKFDPPVKKTADERMSFYFMVGPLARKDV